MPIVTGTKMKWYSVVIPNCQRASSRDVIDTLPSLPAEAYAAGSTDASQRPVVADVRGRAGGMEVCGDRSGLLVAGERLERGRHRGGERVRRVAALQHRAERSAHLLGDDAHVAGHLREGLRLELAAPEVILAVGVIARGDERQVGAELRGGGHDD